MARMKIGDFIGPLYEARYKEHFKHHPDRDEIVAKLIAGNNSVQQIDEWFYEANRYTARWMHDMLESMPKSEDGKVTFRFIDCVE